MRLDREHVISVVELNSVPGIEQQHDRGFLVQPFKFGDKVVESVAVDIGRRHSLKIQLTQLVIEVRRVVKRITQLAFYIIRVSNHHCSAINVGHGRRPQAGADAQLAGRSGAVAPAAIKLTVNLQTCPGSTAGRLEPLKTGN